VRGDSGERGADMMVELRRGSDVYRLCAGLGRARRRNAHAVNQQFVVEFYNFDLLKRTRSVRDAERRTERRTERMPRYRGPPVNSQYRTNRRVVTALYEKDFSSRCFAPLRPSAPLALAPRFRFERSSPAVVVLPPRAQISIK